jgi:hypothetical protein
MDFSFIGKFQAPFQMIRRWLAHLAGDLREGDKQKRPPKAVSTISNLNLSCECSLIAAIDHGADSSENGSTLPAVSSTTHW